MAATQSPSRRRWMRPCVRVVAGAPRKIEETEGEFGLTMQPRARGSLQLGNGSVGGELTGQFYSLMLDASLERLENRSSPRSKFKALAH